METRSYLDTHVLLWLFDAKIDLLSKQACVIINEASLFISPVVILELQYLLETGRIKNSSSEIVNSLKSSVYLNICNMPFEQVIQKALQFSWTSDPFDRIITAQAALNKASLLTKDQTILEHYPQSIWD